jgi:hypothetical protein
MQPTGQPTGQQTLDVTGAMLECAQTIQTLAAKARGTDSAAEAKDFMAGALSGAQVLVQLDPNRLAGGDTPQGRAASVPVQTGKDGDKDGLVNEKR